MTLDLWYYHPAVLYAFATLLGSIFALYSLGPFFIAFSILLLIFPFFSLTLHAAHLRLLLALVLGTAIFCLTSARTHFPEDNTVKTGIADVEIASVKLTKTPFGLMWNYKGTLKYFFQEGISVAKEIPVLISIPFDKESSRPAADARYQFPAKLKTSDHGKYIISPDKKESWQIQSKLFNLAEWRYSAKSAVQNYIQKSVRNTHVGAFLSGMATGEFDDRLLAYELSRFGLQHLMAISGLHFSVISAFFALTLGLFFSRNTAGLITIALMSVYFIFLGASASVARAWIAIVIALASLLIQRRSFSFNTLGIATLIVILRDPLLVEDIGFQFSFGVTAAILLWFSPCNSLLQGLFAKRRLSKVMTMDYWDQHGYCVLYFLREGLALCLAVNLVALPLTLYHFHSFPLMSFVYNLFFPVLVSISLMLLMTASALTIILPLIGSKLHHLNESYTHFVLNFAFNLPKSFDAAWKINGIPKEALLLYLLAIFALGMFLRTCSKSKVQSNFEFF